MDSRIHGYMDLQYGYRDKEIQGKLNGYIFRYRETLIQEYTDTGIHG